MSFFDGTVSASSVKFNVPGHEHLSIPEWLQMEFDPEKHHRRSIRLKDYSYSEEGAYFITVCTNERRCLFGGIDRGEMILNQAGIMVAKTWSELGKRFPGVSEDTYVVMPNHLHGIIWLVGAAPTLGEVIGTFKSITTNKYIYGVKRCSWAPFSGRI